MPSNGKVGEEEEKTDTGIDSFFFQTTSESDII
jgi:hypothetical protein